MKYRNLPFGVQDVLPEECRILDEIKRRLARKFMLGGFEPVSPAALEYYDTYSQIRNAVPQEHLFKLTDTDGRLLVLRPDVTLAISRIAATKLGGASRLSYFADKWDLQSAGGISGREIYQAGVECLGEEGAFSDANTIAFAIECLNEAGLKGFIIDVGHVGFFKGVLEDCGLNEAESEKVRALINAKDGLNAERILRKAGASERTLNTVLALPTLFGGAEVFDRAESLTENACARRAIAHLRKVSDLLIRMGYEDKICFDLGTVRRLSYYSGIVFSGLVKELGAPVLSGGRYDHLADDFGGKIPAVGFAIGLKRLLIGLERQGNLPPEQPLDAVVCCEVGAEELAYRTYLALAAEGKRTRLRTDYAAADASEAAEVYLATKEGVKRV